MNEIILQLYTQYQLLQYLQIVGWVGFPLALATFLISYAVYSSVLCDSVSESIAGKIMVWLPTLMVIASVVLLFVTGYKQMVVLKQACYSKTVTRSNRHVRIT